MNKKKLSVGDGPRTPPRCLDSRGGEDEVSNGYYHNAYLFFKICSNIVPGLAYVGVPHGVGDGPRAPP